MSLKQRPVSTRQPQNTLKPGEQEIIDQETPQPPSFAEVNKTVKDLNATINP